MKKYIRFNRDEVIGITDSNHASVQLQAVSNFTVKDAVKGKTKNKKNPTRLLPSDNFFPFETEEIVTLHKDDEGYFVTIPKNQCDPIPSNKEYIDNTKLYIPMTDEPGVAEDMNRNMAIPLPADIPFKHDGNWYMVSYKRDMTGGHFQGILYTTQGEPNKIEHIGKRYLNVNDEIYVFLPAYNLIHICDEEEFNKKARKAQHCK